MPDPERLIGVISDSHGRLEPVRAAIARLRGRGIDTLVHCGDVGTGANGRLVLDELAAANHEVAVAFVWGNTDHDADELATYARHLGLDLHGHALQLDVAGKRVGVTHGHLRRPFGDAGPVPPLDYLLSGHSHVVHDRRDGPTRLLNPGALHRCPVKTAATLDVVEDRWHVLEVDLSAPAAGPSRK